MRATVGARRSKTPEETITFLLAKLGRAARLAAFYFSPHRKATILKSEYENRRRLVPLGISDRDWKYLRY